MSTESALFLALDLTGTFAFALNGALIAIRVAKLDVVGVVTLGMVTALGGGIVRDIFIASLPPATFSDWRYLAGLSLFAVSGASNALDFDMGAGQAVILGAVTAVGGGTLRDVLIRRIPVVLRSELYAIPALAAAVVVVIADRSGVYGVPAAVSAAVLCFVIRMVGVRFRLNAPGPPGTGRD